MVLELALGLYLGLILGLLSNIWVELFFRWYVEVKHKPIRTRDLIFCSVILLILIVCLLYLVYF